MEFDSVEQIYLVTMILVTAASLLYVEWSWKRLAAANPYVKIVLYIRGLETYNEQFGFSYRRKKNGRSVAKSKVYLAATIMEVTVKIILGITPFSLLTLVS